MYHSNPVTRALQFKPYSINSTAMPLLALTCVLLVACSGQLPDVPEVPALIEPAVTHPTAVTAEPGAPSLEHRTLRQEAEALGLSVQEVRTATLSDQGSAVAKLAMEADHSSYYSGQHPNREHYLDVVESSIKQVAMEPVSTFSIDVDTAAYSNLRRILTRDGRLPPHDAVRIEEMINYFDYDYGAPDSLSNPLAIHTEVMAAPWNPDNQLLLVGIKGFEQPADARPNANLVFLIDVSGSMQSPDKLGLVKTSLQLLVSQMTANDRIALVVYAGAAGVVLDSTTADKQSEIMHALAALEAGGSTNGSAGIELAYHIAEANKIEGGINRVIIASDGDLNVGVTSIDELKELISKQRDNGVALTTLGYGSGNYNYSLMEQLADVGNGNASYIDTLSEARKVLVEEMQSTLLTIAKDVKIQIEFNPAVVSEYRLLGYENRLLQQEDFRNDKIDAGEIGSGHTVTALYEISLHGSRGARLPDSRYAPTRAAATTANISDEIAYVNIRYKLPAATASTEFGVAVAGTALTGDNAPGSNNIQFAAAVAGFGQLLQGGKYTNDWNYDQLLQLARQSRGDDEHGYRSELLKLVELAKVL